MTEGPIAYLTGEYPKVSHTFILREVESLRAHGMAVLTCSIRRPDAAQFRGEEERRARDETFYVLQAARNPLHLLCAHLRIFTQSPGRWFETLGLAWRTRSQGFKALLWQLFYFLEAGVLAAHLRAKGARHLHNHFADSSCSVAMMASALADIPFSFTEHGPNIFFEADRWAIGEKVARARFVLAISHFCRSQLMFFSDPADWGKFTIVHCGVTPSAYGQIPRDRVGKRVIFVGRLDPVKGAPLLVEAFARVLHEHPDAHLTVVGEGKSRAGAEARVQALGIGNAVTFTGFRAQTEVAALLEEADVLVLPSFAEGVPVVLMEAMASRIPVIATRVAGVQELVEDKVSGFTVPPGDVATLVERINDILARPDMARAMGEAGRKTVERDFDIAREGAWLAEIMRAGGSGGRLRPED